MAAAAKLLPPEARANAVGRVITTRTQHIWLDSGGIIHFESMEASEQALADAVENIAAATILAAGIRRRCLVDLRRMKSLSRDARIYYAGDATHAMSYAGAMLIESPVSRMIGNFFLGINKPINKTKLFDSEAEAMQWLEDIRQ